MDTFDKGKGDLLINKFFRQFTDYFYELYPFSKIEKYEDYSLDATIVIMSFYYKGTHFKFKQEFRNYDLRDYLPKDYAHILDSSLNHFQSEITNVIKNSLKERLA